MIRGTPSSRVDERDTTFARMARVPGTRAYEDYYTRHPERREGDDRLRALPMLLEPGGSRYDATICGEAARFFSAIDTIAPDPTLVRDAGARLAAAADPARELRTLARHLGAVASGCCALDPAFVYSHHGRHDHHYGRPIAVDHACAFVFLVEMDHGEMQRAPGAEAIRESARQYYRAAVVARTLAAALAAGGHGARAHYDAHYEVILPPLAVAAGLGELGRHNLLIADHYGTRVRIGAVTTTLPLPPARPRDLGVARFCRDCRKCADTCPSRALSAGDPVEILGVRKWPTDTDRCYRYWRTAGSDCGVCMAVCPFSHRDSAIHNLVRSAVRHAPWLAPALVAADDLLYGRRWPPRGRRPKGPAPGPADARVPQPRSPWRE